MGVVEERIPAGEMETFLQTLPGAIEDCLALHGSNVCFAGLPVDHEWAGPGYAIGALFDPYVLTASLKPTRVVLDPVAKDLPALPGGITMREKRTSLKERIRFSLSPTRESLLHLPTMWGGVPYHALQATADWSVLATIAELPATLVRPGEVFFAFQPLAVLHRYLLMADPRTTGDLTDLLVKAILAASGIEHATDANDLRRDFHALGVNTLLLAQLHRVLGKPWSTASIEPQLREAARLYCAGDLTGAEAGLRTLFRSYESMRRELIEREVYFMVFPHGGILFRSEGYAEYDWPDAAAQVLNLFMDWSEHCGYRCAPDIGAGTLEELAHTFPQTIARMRRLWEEGKLELVNGTYSQPYLQLFSMWEQEQQFAAGLPVFEQLFGRRPTVYAAQEIALHPTLPDILVRQGFRSVIHRAQNLGLAPIDQTPLIEWTAPSGTAIRALPSHRLRSERRGGEVWRHLPVLLTSARNDGLPFIAMTSLMDQTFLDLYTEEIVRANRFAPVWGEFLTPSAFFVRTASLPATKTTYDLDQYHYALDLSGNSIHGHQTGGYSSQHAYLNAEGRRIRALHDAGTLSADDLKFFLNQQAHDCYIIPYFAPGYFMEEGLTDYLGPRYRCSNDQARGLKRAIRDAAHYPLQCEDIPPFTPEPCTIHGGTLRSGGLEATICLTSGAVLSVQGKPAHLGALEFDGAALQVMGVRSQENVLRLSGTLPGFGPVTLEYFFCGGELCAVASVASVKRDWNDTKIAWGSCVSFTHGKPAGTAVLRTVGGLQQRTELERFHSLDTIALQSATATLTLHHGGNIFFRQQGERLQNRLWCYDEFCTRFWWSVSCR